MSFLSSLSHDNQVPGPPFTIGYPSLPEYPLLLLDSPALSAVLSPYDVPSSSGTMSVVLCLTHVYKYNRASIEYEQLTIYDTQGDDNL